MQAAVTVENLIKSYGHRTVLNGVSFQAEKGEIFALLGANGAGKTTALECAEGLKKYDSGLIAVNGKTGIQLQSSALPAHIKPLEAVRLFEKWKKAAPDPGLIKSLGIYEFKKRQYSRLSEGQKRRLHLALALIGDPGIIFLDEPTAGLDAQGRLALHDIIRQLKARGKAVIMASHDLTEVETLCDRIAILKDGKTAFCGTVQQLAEKMKKIHIVNIKTEAGSRTVETDSIADTLLPLLSQLKQKGVKILDIKTNRGTLEEHFIKMVREEEE